MIPMALRNNSTRRLSLAVFSAALLAFLVAAVTLIWPLQAGSAPLRGAVIGERVANLPADCPKTERKSCLVAGRLTGFQTRAGGARRHPYVVPFDGRIVSWSIALSRPSRTDRGERDDELAFFNDFLGSPSKARISVLRRIRRAKPPEYRLVRHSPLQVLNPYFGSVPEFALERPLNVNEGQVVALTVPTWAPAFFHHAGCDVEFPGPPPIYRDAAACAAFGEKNGWRASRRKGRCRFNSDDPETLREQLASSYPQQKIGSKKQYGCFYTAERLLYTATIVREPSGT